MIKVTIDLYNINELKKDAKKFAIEEYREFLLSVFTPSDYDESFKMTYAKYKRGLTQGEIIETIECNDYLFFNDGVMANCISYCGDHSRAGDNVFIFHGVEYLYSVES